MKRTHRLWIIALMVVGAAMWVIAQRSAKTRRESGVLEAIQDYAQEAKAAHEREMESKREALGTPAP